MEDKNKRYISHQITKNAALCCVKEIFIRRSFNIIQQTNFTFTATILLKFGCRRSGTRDVVSRTSLAFVSKHRKLFIAACGASALRVLVTLEALIVSPRGKHSDLSHFLHVADMKQEMHFKHFSVT